MICYANGRKSARTLAPNSRVHIVGSLQFAATCVPAEPVFIRRMIDLLGDRREAPHLVKLSVDFCLTLAVSTNSFQSDPLSSLK